MFDESLIIRWMDIIKKSQLFDEEYYLSTYPDVKESGIDPVRHYVRNGVREGRNPSAFFDTKFYLDTYQDINQSGVNPLFHYILHGVRERRNPSATFNTKYYLDSNAEVRRSGINPLLHYMKLFKEGGDALSPEDAKKAQQPIHSNFSILIDEDKNLSKYDWNKYSEFNPDLVQQGVNPIDHYYKNGFSEGRRLVYKKTYLDNLNAHQRLTVDEYNHYKQARGKAQTVVYTFNYSPNTKLENPKNLNRDIDYIYFGIPVQNEKLTVWEYQDSGFFIESLSLMEAFYCLHPHTLFPEYENTVWIHSFDYLESVTYANIDKFINTQRPQVFLLGEKCLLDKEVSSDISNDNIFNEFKVQKDELFGVIKPACVVLNSKDSLDYKLLSDWWRVIIKYELDSCLPLSFVDKFDAQYYPEALSKVGELFDASAYLQVSNEYQQSIIGNYNLKNDDLLEGLSVTVVVPIFNALEDVKLCLDSIKSSTFDNYRVILADDGSSKDVQEWLETFAETNDRFDARIAKENRGYTLNVNNAIKELSSDFIILLNSDTQVYGRWIEELLWPFVLDSSVGITGPLSNAAGWQTVPFLRGDNTLPEHLNLKKVNDYLQNEAYSRSYAMSDIVNGFCFCFSQDVLKKVGLFDYNQFPMCYGEEDDFCIRSRRHGFKNVVVTSAYVHHSKSKSFGHEKRIKLATSGRNILDEKYGKEGYKLLTDSIGNNPVINAKREKLKELFKPFRTETTVIGENVILVPNKEVEYSRADDFDGNICVHLHLHYVDMVEYFVFYLDNIPFKFDLFITTGLTASKTLLKNKLSAINNVENIEVELFENRGRDIFPFLDVLSKVYRKYKYYLHIHSKKSVHNLLGSKWLNSLTSNLLYSPEYITNLLNMMDKNEIGLMFPPVIEELYPNYKWGKNKPLAEVVLQRLDINLDLDKVGTISFPAGNMHWGRTNALEKLFTAGFTAADFPDEPIPVDGTLAHTLERLFALIVEDAGFSSAIIRTADSAMFEKEKEMFSHRMLSVESVYSHIVDKIDSKEPFALVRFYDGEGAFYKAENWSEAFLQERLGYYFGSGAYSIDDALFIKKLIVSALDKADIIGIPNLDIVDNMLDFTQRFSESNIEKLPTIARRYNESIDCNSAWRILSSFELVTHALSTENIGYCTKDIHYDLVLSGYLYRLLDRVSQVSIITSQNVKPYLEQLFSLNVIEYKVPPRALDAELDSTTNHYPEHFHKLINELSDKDLKGELFLVGAGPLGKHYCEVVKKNGGVAIDIGAVFDSWINFRTRPEHATELSTFNDKLLLTSQNIINLTDSEVVPKLDISVYDLPTVKTNKLLSGLFRK